MSINGLQNILQVLTAFEKAELIMAGFYGVCAGKWPETKKFWRDIQSDEINHARTIKKLAAMINSKPDRFQAGRPFNPVAINTFINGIRANVERVRAGSISMANALFIARDIERSVIESKYGELVKTDDIEYNDAMSAIVKETQDHMSRFEGEIARSKMNG